MALIQKLSSFVTAIIVLPCALLLLVVFADAWNASSKYTNGENDAKWVELGGRVLALVHEVQKERGMSAGFLGSQGQKFSDDLNQQVKATDAKAQALLETVGALSASKKLNALSTDLLGKLEQRAAIRQQVRNLAIGFSETVSFYSSINKLGLQLIGELSRQSVDVTTSTNLLALYHVSQAKEAAGLERAVVTSLLSGRTANPELETRMTRLVTTQKLHMASALETAKGTFYEELVKGTNFPEMTEVNRVREDIMDGKRYDIMAPDQWFDLATRYINKLKVLEDKTVNSIVQHSEDLQSDALTSFFVIILIALIGVVITFVLLMIIRLQQQQSQLITNGIQIASMQRDLAQKIASISGGNLGTAAKSINQLIESFSNDLRDFKAAAQQIFSATNETKSSIAHSRDNLQEQHSRVEMIAAATEEMSVNINVIAESMKENTETAKRVSAESINGQQIVTNAVSGIEELARDLSNSVEALESFNTKVSGISDIVSMILSIAEQTNLLALNAAIEAARAGEQGRGFAVVADEVRNLASRTQSCTVEISSLVGELQDSAKVTSKAITEGQKNAISVAGKTDEIKKALVNIVDQVKNVEGVIETMTINISEQSSALNDVARNVSGIHLKASENVTGAEQIVVATSTIAQSAEKMANLVGRYKIS